MALDGVAALTDEDLLDATAITRLIRIGGVALAKQMIELFLQHGPERMAHAEAGHAVGDMKAIEHASHSLKSSAGNVGATRLQHAAAAVENAVENTVDVATNPADVAPLLKTLRSEYDAASGALKIRLAEITT